MDAGHEKPRPPARHEPRGGARTASLGLFYFAGVVIGVGAGAVSGVVTVPFTLAFCRFPIVCRATRVALRLSTAAAVVAASGTCREGRVIPKSANVSGDVLY
jgi:hypothetical protein